MPPLITLFFVDVVFFSHCPFFVFSVSRVIPGWQLFLHLPLRDRVEFYCVQAFLQAHKLPLGWRPTHGAYQCLYLMATR